MFMLRLKFWLVTKKTQGSYYFSQKVIPYLLHFKTKNCLKTDIRTEQNALVQLAHFCIYNHSLTDTSFN